MNKSTARGQSQTQRHSPSFRKGKRPKKRQHSLTKPHHHHHHDPNLGADLLTPTSISMKNAFIIKNADQSFDSYFTMMRKRKGVAGSPIKVGHHNSIGREREQ